MTTKYITFYGEAFDTDKECILTEANILEQYATIYSKNWDIMLWENILARYWKLNSDCTFSDKIHIRILPQTNTEFNEKYLASVRKYMKQILTDCIPNLEPGNIPTMSGIYDLEFIPVFKLQTDEEDK